ncbi:SirB2 family protein [Pelagibius sp. CAU 1746]|uniref:SirB2 family protein n=1 Tax=Pelagibius sp. CAU 1746 TaxID=3140370 RepID=UPI00325A575A
MSEFYAEIRLVHVWAVVASGLLFALRGLAGVLGAAWPRAAPLWHLSIAIDTVLLTAALMLMTAVGQYPFVDGWLTVKVTLLAVYVGLGIVALGGRRSPTARFSAWLAALLIYGFVVSVALTRDPLGLIGALVN